MGNRVDIKHFGKVVKGRLVYNAPDLLNNHLAGFKDGQEVQVIIQKRRRDTTLNQHRYYRGVILHACYQSEMFSHYDKADDIHDDYFQPKFLSYKKMVIYPDGSKQEITHYHSMADMSDEETSAFIEKVVIDCATNGIPIRSPEEYYESIKQFGGNK